MIDRLFAVSAIALLAVYGALPAMAQSATPQTTAATACPEGTIWDEGPKKCVPIPRGSHDGSIDGN